MHKTFEDVKTAVDTAKESQRETTIVYRNPWKEIKNHGCKHQQQNTIDGRKNLRC